jgi:enoyl-CoA hydratase/carnithine racemase
MGEIRVGHQDSIATVTLTNPGRRNAIDARMWGELARVMSMLSADTALRCVVLRGAEGHFAGGADITEFPQLRSDRARLLHYHGEVIAPALEAIEACLHPTIAAIEGVCVGGGLEIACRCDLRIADAAARLGVPIHRLGFPMAPIELAGLIAVAGRATALELLLEGRLLTAEEASLRRLVTRVCAAGELEHALADSIAHVQAGAPLAARINKALVRRLAALGSALDADDLELAFSYHDSDDHREGIAAFLEGREPQFRGH